MRKPPKMRSSRRLPVLIASFDDATRLRWRKALGNSFAAYDRGGITGLASLLREIKPAVLLLDLNLRRLAGVRSIPSFQKLSPSTKIIVVTKTPRLKEEILALKLGAKGYTGKDISTTLLRKAVRLVERGELWTHRRIIATLLDEVMSSNQRSNELSDPHCRLPVGQLTAKKQQIVRSIADGLTNYDIARRLDISEATVKAHLTAIYRKFAITNRAQLAAVAAVEIKAISAPSFAKHA